MIAASLSVLTLLALAFGSATGQIQTFRASFNNDSSSLVAPEEFPSLRSHGDDYREPTERILETNATKYTVPVYFWHAYDPKDRRKRLTERDIRTKYLSHLKRSFKNTPFSFALKGIRIIESADYGRCVQDGKSERLFKAEHKVHGLRVLNVYICNTAPFDPSAWSTPPAAAGFADDGIVLGNFKVYKSGDERRIRRWAYIGHETGHWLGLFHTFEVS
jgi:hypothetical protein